MEMLCSCTLKTTLQLKLSRSHLSGLPLLVRVTQYTAERSPYFKGDLWPENRPWHLGCLRTRTSIHFICVGRKSFTYIHQLQPAQLYILGLTVGPLLIDSLGGVTLKML